MRCTISESYLISLHGRLSTNVGKQFGRLALVTLSRVYLLLSSLPPKADTVARREDSFKINKRNNEWDLRDLLWEIGFLIWVRLHTHIRSRVKLVRLRGYNLLGRPDMNLNQLPMFSNKQPQSIQTHTAVAAHLHDKGLVNYLRTLIWSIQGSCIRLQGQSEPLDSIGLHYSWERPGQREDGKKKREQSDREQQQRSWVLFHVY